MVRFPHAYASVKTVFAKNCDAIAKLHGETLRALPKFKKKSNKL